MNLFLHVYAAPPEMAAHAAALMVIAPIIGACAAILAPNARWSWAIAAATSVVSAWMALSLAGDVARKGVVEYAMGGFAPPLGIALRVDALGAFMALMIAFSGAMFAVASGHFLNAEVRARKHQLYQAGMLICQAGLLGVVATGDAFNAFVMLEVASIGTYALVAIGQDRRAGPAAFNYLIMGSIGATFFVLGVGFLYAATGTLNMADLARLLPPISREPPVLAGVSLIMVGLGVKAAMFPLHGWLPRAYAHAPTLISGFLSSAATKTAFYLMVRFAFTVFGDGPAPQFFSSLLGPLAAAGIVVVSLQAMMQQELRRILALSSVAQAGLLLLALALGTGAALAAALLHVLAHGLLKGAMFMAAGGTAPKAVRIADFNGAVRRAPWAMSAFMICGFSLIGAPLTAGFISKWMLVQAMIQVGWIWGVVAIAASSLASVVYVGRMLEAIFFKPAAAGGPEVREAPLGVLVPLLAMAGLTLWIGLDARSLLDVAQTAAQALSPSGGAP